MRRRQERVNDLLRDELSQLLSRQVRDPRLSSLVSITDVEVSPDLRHARVFVSVLGSEQERASVLAALRSAAGFLRHELSDHLALRYTPELAFHLDDSIERGARVLALLQSVSEEAKRSE